MGSFDLGQVVAALYRDGTSGVIEIQPGTAPPVRLEGFTVGAPFMTQSAPHRGELHPDGDELLYLISGRVDVILDDGDQDTSGPSRSSRSVPVRRSSCPKASGTASMSASRATSSTSRPDPGAGTARCDRLRRLIATRRLVPSQVPRGCSSAR